MPADLPSRRNNNVHVLVIDPDPAIGLVLRKLLADSLPRIEWAPNGIDAKSCLAVSEFDLITVELELPDQPGLELLRDIRMNYLGPLIVITSLPADPASQASFNLNADDFVSKPINPANLAPRVNALLRRFGMDHPRSVEDHQQRELGPGLQFAGFRMEMPHGQLFFPDGGHVALTHAEANLLRYFLLHPQKQLTRSAINRQLHGQDTANSDQSVDGLISKLRKKLRMHRPRSEFFLSIRNFGYEFLEHVTPFGGTDA